MAAVTFFFILERDIPFMFHLKKGKTIQETQLTCYKEALRKTVYGSNSCNIKENI
jgi:hypothetical protein